MPGSQRSQSALATWARGGPRDGGEVAPASGAGGTGGASGGRPPRGGAELVWAPRGRGPRPAGGADGGATARKARGHKGGGGPPLPSGGAPMSWISGNAM